MPVYYDRVANYIAGTLDVALEAIDDRLVCAAEQCDTEEEAKEVVHRIIGEWNDALAFASEHATQDLVYVRNVIPIQFDDAWGHVESYVEFE